jgi:hypothetical protein
LKGTAIRFWESRFWGRWGRNWQRNGAPPNIRDAIREYLSVVEEQLRGEEIREVEVTL